MKKFITKGFLLSFILLVLMFSAACSKSDMPTTNTETTKQEVMGNQFNAMLKYYEFLSGKINIPTDFGVMTLDDCIRFGDPKLEKSYRYAYFDMNKDGIPELLLDSCGELTIITVKNNNLILAGGGYYLTVLKNGSVLKVRDGGAPTHIDYDYITLDFNGNQTDVCFSKYKDPSDDKGEYKFNKNDRYLFDNKTVSKEKWDSLTKEYLSVPKAEIDWKPYKSYSKN